MTAILIFHGAAGYRHESTQAGVAAVLELAAAAGVRATATDDPAVFTSGALDDVDAVVWMQNSGTGILDAAQRRAYEAFTEAGGGFAGVHATSDGERDWPLFDRLVGARFKSHPLELRAARLISEGDDPSMAGVPSEWIWTEEWYNFEENPRGRVTIIATVSESDFDPSANPMGSDHPVVWRTEIGSARAWYTALGHEAEAFRDSSFRTHLWDGISSVLRPSNHSED